MQDSPLTLLKKPTIRKGQLNFIYDKDAIAWIKDILSHKISNQQATLLMLPEMSDLAEEKRMIAIDKMENYREKSELSWTRNTQIQLYAQKLAQKFVSST